jgi:hypothetical protein
MSGTSYFIVLTALATVNRRQIRETSPMAKLDLAYFTLNLLENLIIYSNFLVQYLVSLIKRVKDLLTSLVQDPVNLS